MSDYLPWLPGEAPAAVDAALERAYAAEERAAQLAEELEREAVSASRWQDRALDAEAALSRWGPLGAALDALVLTRDRVECGTVEHVGDAAWVTLTIGRVGLRLRGPLDEVQALAAALTSAAGGDE